VIIDAEAHAFLSMVQTANLPEGTLTPEEHAIRLRVLFHTMRAGDPQISVFAVLEKYRAALASASALTPEGRE
jgi:hypothetical protein